VLIYILSSKIFLHNNDESEFDNVMKKNQHTQILFFFDKKVVEFLFEDFIVIKLNISN